MNRTPRFENKTPLLVIAGLLAVAVVAGVWTTSTLAKTPTPQEIQKKRLLREFMRGKLEASQQVLEGIVTEDYKLIEKGAEKLVEISGAEQWRISNDRLYRQHSEEFKRIAAKLVERSKKEQADAIALTWLEATMSCIECHKFVRSMRIAAEE